MGIIKINNIDCHIEDFISRNNALGLKAINADTRELVKVLTVSNDKLAPGEIAIQDDKIITLLQDSGYIGKQKRIIKHGFNTAKVFKYKKSFNEV